MRGSSAVVLTPTTIVETGAEEVVSEAESVSSLPLAPTPALEVLPMPAFIPAAVEAPIGAAEFAAPTVEGEILPGLTEEVRAQPLPRVEVHAEVKLGLSVLALVGFLSLSREIHRPSHKNPFVRGRETD